MSFKSSAGSPVSMGTVDPSLPTAQAAPDWVLNKHHIDTGINAGAKNSRFEPCFCCKHL